MSEQYVPNVLLSTLHSPLYTFCMFITFLYQVLNWGFKLLTLIDPTRQNQELMEAAHSVVSVTEAGENIRDSAAIGLSVAGSLATVISRHIITASSQNRATQFIVSLPLPMLWNRGSLGSGNVFLFFVSVNVPQLDHQRNCRRGLQCSDKSCLLVSF